MDNYKNLISIFTIFKNNPYYLCKFLIVNNALNSDFLDKIYNNDNLANIDLIEMSKGMHFNNISEMNNYFNSLVEDLTQLSNGATDEEIETMINKLLDESILKEDYEESSRIRDYMILNKIKRVK